MRTFRLIRNEDVSGVSGTGVICEGVEFHDRQVALSWFGQHHTLEIAPSIESVVAIHGHEGRTIIEWDQPENLTNKLKRIVDTMEAIEIIPDSQVIDCVVGWRLTLEEILSTLGSKNVN